MNTQTEAMTFLDASASRTAWASLFFKHLFEHDISIPEFTEMYGLNQEHFVACFNSQDAFDVLELLALSRLTGLTLVQITQEWEDLNNARENDQRAFLTSESL